MSATDMSPPPLPLPQPALVLPDLAPGTCTGGSLPEVEVDKGGGSSQQTAALPVQSAIKEEERTVSLPQHVEDVLEKSIKIRDYTVRNNELRVADGGSMLQPEMQIMKDTFGDGGEDNRKEKVKEKSSDAWVPQIIGQDVIIDIDKVPTTDNASDAPAEDNATPLPAETLGMDIASVVPVVHQPFKQPTLFVPSSHTLPVGQSTIDETSKPAYIFAAPPPPGPFTFGKPPSQLSPFGVSSDSPAPGLVLPPQSATSPFFTPQFAGGSAQLGLKFTPYTPILTSTRGLKAGLSYIPRSTNSPVASDELSFQTLLFVAPNGVSIQASSALASTQASSNPFDRHMPPGGYTSIASLHRVPKSASPKPFALTQPNIHIAYTVGNQHRVRVRPGDASTMITSDRIMEPIIKAEEVEQFPMVINHRRSSLMDAIPSNVKKRLLPQEVLQLSKVQERIDAAQDANSVGLFSQIPPSVILTNNELKDIRNVQSRIYDEQHGLTPAKRQKLNDEGEGKRKHNDKSKITPLKLLSSLFYATQVWDQC